MQTGWSKQPGEGLAGDLGLASAGGATPALATLTGPVTVTSVRDLGPTLVDGAATTRYLIQSVPRPICPTRAGQPGLPTESAPIWVDGQGRLVEVRDSSSFSGKLPVAFFKATPALADRPMGPTTTINTLRFSAFAERVRVTPPAAIEGRSFSVVALRHISVVGRAKFPS